MITTTQSLYSCVFQRFLKIIVIKMVIKIICNQINHLHFYGGYCDQKMVIMIKKDGDQNYLQSNQSLTRQKAIVITIIYGDHDHVNTIKIGNAFRHYRPIFSTTFGAIIWNYHQGNTSGFWSLPLF